MIYRTYTRFAGKEYVLETEGMPTPEQLREHELAILKEFSNQEDQEKS